MYHDRQYFYKYVTAEAAFLILQNQTLKYSSPIIFNDPFDVQTKLDYGFTIEEMMEVFIDELFRLIHDEVEPVGPIVIMAIEHDGQGEALPKKKRKS